MDNPGIIWTFKPIGFSPKDCIDKIQLKAAFAGRLDPMASGLLPLIIHNNDSKKVQELKESLQDSDKVYQFKIILELESDSYDILGLVKKSSKEFNLEKIKETKIQEYPMYSSQKAFSKKYQKRVPLWKIAKIGETLLPKDIPKREIEIKNITILNKEEISNTELLEIIRVRINSLKDKTNFRNDEIMNCWEKELKDNKIFKVYHIEALVSSGTYIRSICNSLGGVAYDICRTQYSNMVLEKADSINKFEFAIIYPFRKID